MAMAEAKLRIPDQINEALSRRTPFFPINPADVLCLVNSIFKERPAKRNKPATIEKIYL
jgi:hypothetical protein